jgi:ribonuclease HI
MKTKQEILDALDSVDPLPQTLIDELTAATDSAIIRRKISTWMGRPKEDWKEKRPEDGADIYNALHPNQGTLQHAMRVCLTNFTQGQRRR